MKTQHIHESLLDPEDEIQILREPYIYIYQNEEYTLYESVIITLDLDQVKIHLKLHKIQHDEIVKVLLGIDFLDTVKPFIITSTHINITYEGKKISILIAQKKPYN